MILRVLRGLSLDTIHTAFRMSKFECLSMEAYDNLPSDEQAAADRDHTMVLEEREKVEQFSSMRLGQTAVHPEPDPRRWPPKEGLNRQKPRVNCLRRYFSDVAGDPGLMQEDCVMLANRVQRHRCDQKYCLRLNPVTNQLKCKFHYPQSLEGFTAQQEGNLVTSITNNLAEMNHAGARFQGDSLVIARNHCRLVETAPEIMMGWRGNTNTAIVKSIDQLRQYVLKYMLKPTTGSASFENTVKDITAQQESDTNASSIYQKVLMRQITEHDLPRTEAFRIVSGMPFVFYSREFRMVNLLGVRRVETDDMALLETMDIDEPGNVHMHRRATKDNIADLYWARESQHEYRDLVQHFENHQISLPWHPKDINLYNFAAHFDKKWKLTNKTFVPHISPLFRYRLLI